MRSIVPPTTFRGPPSAPSPRRPAAFGNAAGQVDAALAMAGRPRDGVRRSVEVDAALLDAPAPVAAVIERFCRRRGIARDHPLLDAALVGDTDAVVARA